MGIIRAAMEAVSGGLADQWLEVYEPDDMGERTVFTRGVKTRKGQNARGSSDTVSNGSVIHVYDNQFMMLVDGGKIIDYTAEPGYYKVDNSSLPSLFNGQLRDAVKESFQRVKFGGQTPTMQKVFYINLQEIKGIKFGTRNPVNYFDSFYNAELFLRAHGTYSIKITDPVRFYGEAIPRNAEQVEIEDINGQYLSEFLEALQSAINQMSADGIRISYVASKGRELGKYMADTLDEDWNRMRGMEIQAVGIASVSYDEKSTELINMRNEGAMLGDPTVREGYLQAIWHGAWKRQVPMPMGQWPGLWAWELGCRQGAAPWAQLLPPICSKCRCRTRTWGTSSHRGRGRMGTSSLHGRDRAGGSRQPSLAHGLVPAVQGTLGNSVLSAASQSRRNQKGGPAAAAM